MDVSLSAAIRFLTGVFDSLRWASKDVIVTRFKWIGIMSAALLALWGVGFGVVHVIGQGTRSTPYCLPSCYADADGLVVYVHGWRGSPDTLRALSERVRQIPQFKNYRAYLWSFDAGRFSNLDPNELATDLMHDIRRVAPAGKPVVLVGHSTGGLIVRRAYLDALTFNEPWAQNVSRIVLLASPNRGAMAISRSVMLHAADALARSYGVGRFIQANYRVLPVRVREGERP